MYSLLYANIEEINEIIGQHLNVLDEFTRRCIYINTMVLTNKVDSIVKSITSLEFFWTSLIHNNTDTIMNLYEIQYDKQVDRISQITDLNILENEYPYFFSVLDNPNVLDIINNNINTNNYTNNTTTITNTNNNTSHNYACSYKVTNYIHLNRSYDGTDL